MEPGSLDHAARSVLEAIPMVMRTLGAELRKSGHTLTPSHFRMLMMLSRRPFNLSELAARQAVSLPTMSRSVRALVDRGWVSRKPSQRDRREVLIELTEKGEEVLDEMQRHAVSRVRRLLEPLPASERRLLVEGLQVLRKAFRKQPFSDEGPVLLDGCRSVDERD